MSAAEVLKKLQTGFGPAVRSVAETSGGLRTAGDEYFKALDNHFREIGALARTAGGTENSEHFAAELSGVVESFLKITKEDREWDPNIMHQFQNAELKKARDLHTQRFAYFARNYLELLRKHSEKSKQNLESAEKQLLDSDAAEAVKRLDEAVEQNDTVRSVVEVIDDPILSNNLGFGHSLNLRIEETQREEIIEEIREDPIEQREVESHRESHRESNRESNRESEPPTRVSTHSRVSEAKILDPKIYKPTPILGLQSEQNRRIPRPSTDVRRIPSNGHSSVPNRGGLATRPELYAAASVIRSNSNTERYNAPVPDYVKSPPKLYAKPAFVAADYGRVLECIQTHRTHGEHQLSLNAGDRIKLIKSGTRGWILGRTADSRQGWFPAKFVRLC